MSDKYHYRSLLFLLAIGLKKGRFCGLSRETRATISLATDFNGSRNNTHIGEGQGSI
jgi:hypothetical protein